MLKSLKTFTLNLIRGRYKKTTDFESKRILFFLNSILLLAILSSGLSFLLNIAFQNIKMSIVTGSLLLVFPLTFIYLRKTGNIKSVSTFISIFFLLFMTFLFYDGGSGNTGHLWTYTFPVFVFYLVGKKLGFIYSSIFLLLSLASFFPLTFVLFPVVSLLLSLLLLL